MTICSPPPTVPCTGCKAAVAVCYFPPGSPVAAPMPPAGEYPVRCEKCGAQMVVTVKETRRSDGSLLFAELKTRPAPLWEPGKRR